MPPECAGGLAWRADFMRIEPPSHSGVVVPWPARGRLARLHSSLSVWAVLGLAILSGRAAELKHDLYFCANLSGQKQVMGSRVTVPSGLYRSSDRQNVEHLGFSHIRLFSMTHDVRDPDTLFLATLDGVVRAKDRGRTWRIMTTWDMTEAKSIAFDPSAPEHVYAGLPDGIAVSHDRGQTWRRMQEGIRRSYTQAIAVDRTKAGRVLAGTEKGVYVTENGARTWTLVQPTAETVTDLQQSPHDPRVFFMATTKDGAFLSKNGGLKWERVAGVPTEHTLHNVDFDPKNPDRLVVCGWGTGVLVSEDGGKTWIDRTAGLPKREIWSVVVDPDLPDRLYAAPYLDAVHVSDDFGRTWRKLFFEQAIVFDMVFVPRQ